MSSANHEEEDVKEYRWETGYEKTWESIKEDDEGRLEASVAEIIQRAKRKAQLERKDQNRLGMMRYLFVILDSSEAMLDQDLKPTRQLCVLKILESFIDEYLYESPLSLLGFILTRNKKAEKLTDLSGNGKKHLEELKKCYNDGNHCTGEPSMQNALELAMNTLKNMPTHASREILIIMGSLTTCDPGDISVTIQSLKKHGICVSVVGVGAEVHLCSVLCKTTGGKYRVALDDTHLKHLLSEHVPPPPAAPSENALVKMGFPHQSDQNKHEPCISLCMCHLESDNNKQKTKSVFSKYTGDGGNYECPQCKSKYCRLPTECQVCGLTLVSAPHLARSYHHLFPIAPFIELGLEGQNWVPEHCYSCYGKFKKHDKYVYKCDKCNRLFCLDCDLFIHDTLHTCPGCATSQANFQQKINS